MIPVFRTKMMHGPCSMNKVKLLKVMSENVEEDLHQFDVKLKFLTFRGTLLFINVQPIILGLLRQD